MFAFVTARVKDMSLDCTMTHMELWAMFGIRIRAIGERYKFITLTDDNKIDWGKCMPWKIEKARELIQISHRYLDLTPVIWAYDC